MGSHLWPGLHLPGGVLCGHPGPWDGQEVTADIGDGLGHLQQEQGTKPLPHADVGGHAQDREGRQPPSRLSILRVQRTSLRLACPIPARPHPGPGCHHWHRAGVSGRNQLSQWLQIAVNHLSDWNEGSGGLRGGSCLRRQPTCPPWGSGHREPCICIESGEADSGDWDSSVAGPSLSSPHPT